MLIPPKGIGAYPPPATRSGVPEPDAPSSNAPISDAPDGFLQTRVWDGEAEDFQYPEQAAGLVRERGLTGVCFSGGGNRAMVAAWGQLRGLVESGWIESVDYVSCVSGGSWAATAFTYYNEGANNDEEFLGLTQGPDKLRLNSLEQISPFSFGATATESFMSRLVEQALFVATGQITPNEVWQRAVGATFFERFGLYDRSGQEYISYDEETVADILRRNPSLQGARFHTVRNKIRRCQAALPGG